MEDEAYIALIYPHSECIGANHEPTVAFHEPLVGFFPFLLFHTAVIQSGLIIFVCQAVIDFRRLFPCGAVNDPGFLFMPFQEV